VRHGVASGADHGKHAAELGGEQGISIVQQVALATQKPVDAVSEVARNLGHPCAVKCLRLPARSPDLNSVAERFVLSIKSECLSKLVPLGENHLRRAVSEYIEHYHRERNHQGLGNRLLLPAELVARPANNNAPVECLERLGGLLNFYYRRAA